MRTWSKRASGFVREATSWSIVGSLALGVMAVVMDGVMLAYHGTGAAHVVGGALLAGALAILVAAVLAPLITVGNSVVRKIESLQSRARCLYSAPAFLAVFIVAWSICAPQRRGAVAGYAVVVFCSASGVAIAVWMTRWRRPRRAEIAGLAMAALCLAIDMRFPPSLYLELHHLARIGAAAGLLVALAPLRRQLVDLPIIRTVGITAALVSFALVVVGSVDRLAPGWRTSSVLYAHNATAHTRLLRTIVDADLDGYSPILWGADCDDFDSDRHPAAADAADRDDANCNDSRPPATVGPAAFGLAPEAGSPALAPDSIDLVLLITIDTWRADSAVPSLMPRLNQIAERGVMFERLYAAGSNTRLAVPSIHRSSAKSPTVAEIVAGRGVAVSATIAVSLDPAAYGFPNDKNFGQEAIATDITDRAIERIREHRGHKHLAWVHYYDPHLPYTVHDSIVTPAEPASLPSAYRSEVRYLDFHLGRLFDELEQDGMLDRAVVIIVGDHGEGFGARGIVGHGRTGYDEMFRVPGVLIAPGLRPGRYSHVTSHKDIPATILGAFGLAEAAVEAEYLGRSWLRLRGEPDKPLHEFVVARSSRFVSGLSPVVALAALVTDDGWKLVARREDRLFELYDLRTDPGETTNLAPEQPEMVQALWRRLALVCDLVGFPEKRLRL